MFRHPEVPGKSEGNAAFVRFSLRGFYHAGDPSLTVSESSSGHLRCLKISAKCNPPTLAVSFP